jgi:hypothetical protein
MAQVLIDLLGASERVWQQPGRGQLSSGGTLAVRDRGGGSKPQPEAWPLCCCAKPALCGSRRGALCTHIVNL